MWQRATATGAGGLWLGAPAGDGLALGLVAVDELADAAGGAALGDEVGVLVAAAPPDFGWEMQQGSTRQRAATASRVTPRMAHHDALEPIVVSCLPAHEI